MASDQSNDEQVSVAEAGEEDHAWVHRLIEDRWGPVVISRGRVYQVDRLGALVATMEGERVGLLTYRVDAAALEVLTVDSLVRGRGVSTALLRAAEGVGRSLGLRRVWLVVSNDNLDGLLFYLRRGMRIVAVHLDAIEESRRLKPSIPVLGEYGVPVRDELELELSLEASADARG